MENTNTNEKVIKNYQENEKMMILIFCQWCVNNDLDARELYKKAYPQQVTNELLEEVIGQTVSKAETDQINDETVLNVLQLFGNDDLAFVVQGEIEKLGTKK